MNKTRTSFRPRPLDVNKQLEIITDPEVSFDVAADPAAGPAPLGPSPEEVCRLPPAPPKPPLPSARPLTTAV